MPPPRRRSITLDDGSELDLGDLPEGYAPADLGVDLGGIEGLDAPAVVERPAGSPPPVAPGVEWTYSGGAGDATRYRAVPAESPEGRAIREAREEYEMRSLTAEPSPAPEASAPPPATSETVTGPVTARAVAPDGIVASPASRRRVMEPVDPAEAEAIRVHGGRAPAVFDEAGRRVTFPSWAAYDTYMSTLRSRRGADREAAAEATRAESAASAERAMAEANAADRAAAADERMLARLVGPEPLGSGPPVSSSGAPIAVSEEEAAASGSASAEPGARSASAADAARARYREANANPWLDPLGSLNEAVRSFLGIEDPTADDDAALMAMLEGEDGAAPVAGAAVPAPDGGVAGGGVPGRAGGRRRMAVAAAPAAPPGPTTSAQGGANPMLARALERNDEALDLARRRAESEAGGYADTGRAMRDAEAARIENEDMRRRAMGDARERYRAAMERATSMTLDPEGWYHERGVLGSIGAAIAVAMGSLGSGITGGTNEALGIINASIERDIQAQLTAIDQANSRVAGEANLLDMLAGEFQSRDAAVAAARAAMLEDVANRVATEAAGMNTEEARIAAEEMHDQLITEANAAAAAAIQAEQDRAIDLYLREAQAREAMADALRAERRASGAGAGGVVFEEPTMARLDTADRMAERLRIPLAEAFARVGMDPSLASGAGGVSRVLPPADRADLATLSNALDEIDAVAGTLDAPVDAWTGVSGVGLVDQMLPDVMVGEEGRRIRRAITNASDVLQRLRSGAAGPLAEWERYRGLIVGAGTEDALRENVAAIRREIEAILGAAPYPEAAPGEELDAAAAEYGLEEAP